MKFVINIPALDRAVFNDMTAKDMTTEVKTALFKFGITPAMIEVLGVFHEDPEAE